MPMPESIMDILTLSFKSDILIIIFPPSGVNFIAFPIKFIKHFSISFISHSIIFSSISGSIINSIPLASIYSFIGLPLDDIFTILLQEMKIYTRGCVSFPGISCLEKKTNVQTRELSVKNSDLHIPFPSVLFFLRNCSVPHSYKQKSIPNRLCR